MSLREPTFSVRKFGDIAQHSYLWENNAVTLHVETKCDVKKRVAFDKESRLNKQI